jgi:hypothetical protein
MYTHDQDEEENRIIKFNNTKLAKSTVKPTPKANNVVNSKKKPTPIVNVNYNSQMLPAINIKYQSNEQLSTSVNSGNSEIMKIKKL